MMDDEFAQCLVCFKEIWGCVQRISSENVAKLYFDFLGQDLAGF